MRWMSKQLLFSFTISNNNNDKILHHIGFIYVIISTITFVVIADFWVGGGRWETQAQAAETLLTHY